MFYEIGADDGDGTITLTGTKGFGVAWAFRLRLPPLLTCCCIS